MKTKIPKQHEVNENVSVLRTKLDDINAQIRVLQDEAKPIRHRMFVLSRPDQGNGLNNRVQEALARNVDAVRSPDHVRLDAILNELHVLNLASEQLHRDLAVEERRATVAICDQVRPDHDRLAKVFAEKLVELHRAHVDYVSFLDGVTDIAVSSGPLNPVLPNGLGHPRDQSGTYAYSLREFKDAGYLSELPTELQPQ